MATKTTNYNLTKPAYNEDADIKVINDNMDIIDAKMKEIEDAGGGSTITVDAELSTESENPVQNKVITNKINEINSNLQNYIGKSSKQYFTLPAYTSLTFTFAGDRFGGTLSCQGNNSNSFGYYIIQGYGIGLQRYHIQPIQNGNSISLAISEEQYKIILTNNDNSEKICCLSLDFGTQPEIS